VIKGLYKCEIFLLICTNTEKQGRTVSGCGFAAFYFLVSQSGESVFHTY